MMMSENQEFLRRLLAMRGESLSSGMDSLLTEFANDEEILMACDGINQWEHVIMKGWRDKTARADLGSAPVSLANGMVDRDYCAEIRLGSMDMELGEHRCLLATVPGLSYDPATRLLTGIPTEAGEYDVILEFKPLNSESDLWSRRTIKFIVNHDPKSLWKDEPSDREDPYWQSDEAMEASKFGCHLVMAVSKRGRSHAHEGKFRDDAFRLAYFEETGWGVIAVSDGAGASKYSRKGSVLACDAVTEFFSSLPSERWSALDEAVQTYLKEPSDDSAKQQINAVIPDLIGNAAQEAQHAIHKEAIGKGFEMRDYSCTLIFALCRQYPTHFVVASFWVGDGGIGVYEKESDSVQVLGEPDSGEYAGQTRFLTMGDTFIGGAHFKRIRFKAVDKFTSLILMSDGITDPKFQTDANLKDPVMWRALWDEISPFGVPNGEVEASCDDESRNVAFLNWLDFWSPGNHDDRTIAVLYSGTA